MKNENLCDLIFRKNFTFGRRTSKFAKENPKIAPPQEKKEKKSKTVLIIINQKKKQKGYLQNCRLCCPSRPLNKTERMWKKGYVPGTCSRIEKAVEHESDDCTNYDWCFWDNNQRIIKRPGGLGSWRTGGDYPNDSITDNGQNTE